MADERYNRTQRAPGEAQRRPAVAAGQQGGDPLAELARLIGQNDSFSNFARDPAAVPQPMPSAPEHAAVPHDPRYDHPQAGWPTAAHDPHAAPDFSPPPDMYRKSDDYPDYGHPPAAPRYQDDPRAAPPRAAAFAQAYEDPHPHGGGHGQGHYDERYDDRGAGAETAGMPPRRAGGHRGYPDDPYYGAQDDDLYEDREPRRRRGGMLTLMAVLALAVLGTASAFGYRVIFGGPSVPANPPVIKANTAPTKVVPAAQAGDPNSGKLIYDRVGERNQTERIVPREEAPMEVKTAPPPPRVVLSNNASPSAAAAFAPQAPAGTVAAPVPVASTEPKKIRTLTIRPDEPAAAPTSRASAPPPQRAVEPEPQMAPPVTRTVAPRAAAPSDPNAPLSLVPQGGAMRTASASPSRPVALSTPSNGGYAVQVTSRRSEAEAQASYQALQAQFPGVLGNRQAFIRRADLGDKGVYYRALVGSFSSSDEASQLCRDLKAAGGECVVQRN